MINRHKVTETWRTRLGGTHERQPMYEYIRVMPNAAIGLGGGFLSHQSRISAIKQMGAEILFEYRTWPNDVERNSHTELDQYSERWNSYEVESLYERSTGRTLKTRDPWDDLEAWSAFQRSFK
jgi:hypothetical protein